MTETFDNLLAKLDRIMRSPDFSPPNAILCKLEDGKRLQAKYGGELVAVSGRKDDQGTHYADAGTGFQDS